MFFHLKKQYNISERKYLDTLYYLIKGNFQIFIENYIEENEGISFCIDKITFIKQTLLKALVEKKNQSLILYNKKNNSSDDKGYSELMQWSPYILKDTDELIELFQMYN